MCFLCWRCELYLLYVKDVWPLIISQFGHFLCLNGACWSICSWRFRDCWTLLTVCGGVVPIRGLQCSQQTKRIGLTRHCCVRDEWTCTLTCFALPVGLTAWPRTTLGFIAATVTGFAAKLRGWLRAQRSLHQRVLIEELMKIDDADVALEGLVSSHKRKKVERNEAKEGD